MSYRTRAIDDLGAKTGILKIAGESIKTPFRVLTSKEAEYGNSLEAKGLVAPISYGSPIVQFTKNFNEDGDNTIVI